MILCNINSVEKHFTFTNVTGQQNKIASGTFRNVNKKGNNFSHKKTGKNLVGPQEGPQLSMGSVWHQCLASM